MQKSTNNPLQSKWRKLCLGWNLWKRMEWHKSLTLWREDNFRRGLCWQGSTRSQPKTTRHHRSRMRPHFCRTLCDALWRGEGKVSWILSNTVQFSQLRQLLKRFCNSPVEIVQWWADYNQHMQQAHHLGVDGPSLRENAGVGTDEVVQRRTRFAQEVLHHA